MPQRGRDAQDRGRLARAFSWAAVDSRPPSPNAAAEKAAPCSHGPRSRRISRVNKPPKLQAGADPIDDEIAAILDPFGNATHTALAFNVVGEGNGADHGRRGPIGIMAVAIARHGGARHVVITDVNRLPPAPRRGDGRLTGAQRRARIARRGRCATSVWRKASMSVSKCRAMPSALREMLRTMNHGGSISMLGIPPGETAIDWNQVIFKGSDSRASTAARCSRPGTRWLDDPERPERPAGHHAPVRRPRLFEGFEIMNPANRGR